VKLKMEEYKSDDKSLDRALALKDDGNTALSLGKTLEAIVHYTNAICVSPTPNAVILSNRSLAYIRIENYGLAIVDATAAIKADPTYAKGYYRRGTAEFALNKPKAARKDFRTVCKLKTKDKDARNRLIECEKVVKEAAFAAAIVNYNMVPLSESYDPNVLSIDTGSYNGPHPHEGCNLFADDKLNEEESLFLAGNLPMKFVMVRFYFVTLNHP